MNQRPDSRYFSQDVLWGRPAVGEQLAVADDLVSMIPPDVRTILDAGCGNGTVTNRLADRWEVTGCDLSETALRQVHTPTAVVDLSAIPFPDAAFDLVMASDVIEHLPEHLYKRALAELTRVARRYLLIAVPHREILAAAEVNCPSCAERYHAHLHQRSYSGAEVTRLFAPQFAARRARLSGERWSFEDPDLLSASRKITGLDYPFEDAVCPRCGSRRGPVPRAAAAEITARRFEAYQSMLSSTGLRPRPHRSEILVLFERDAAPGVDQVEDDAECLLPSLIDIGQLGSRANPANHPDAVVRLGGGGDYLILALPFSPNQISVRTGSVESVDVFDSVRQRYVACPCKGGGLFDVPAVAWGVHGCLIRLLKPSPDLVVGTNGVPNRTSAEIAAICFGDDSLIDSLEDQLRVISAQATRLEAARAWLEEEVQRRDQLLLEAGRRLESANELANRIEAQRALLDQRVLELQKEIETGRSERRALEAERDVANIVASSVQRSGSVKPVPQAVLVLSHMYPRDYHPAGGVFVHEQVKALRAAGVDARVLSGEPFWINTLNPLRIARALLRWWRTPVNAWEEHDGVPLLRFPYIVGALTPFPLHAFTYTVGAMRCESHLRKTFNFQLVHSHTSYTDGSAGGRLATRFDVPLVITEHTGPFRTLTRTPYLRRRTEAAINAADRLIAVSTSLLSDVHREIFVRRRDRTRVVPNVVDTAQFVLRPRSLHNCVRVLWVGHFVAVKRVDVLLDALAQAVRVEQRLCLRLVGSGELEADIRQRAANLGLGDRIEFAGHSDRQGLAEHYAQCDFLVISSESETFGVVAIEAMSCGRPVLTTDCGGPEDVVTHPSLGMVVGKSTEALAQGLVDMAARREEFVPELIREVAVRRYSTSAVSAALIDVYSEVLEKK